MFVSARHILSTLPCAPPREALSMPRDDGRRSHNGKRVRPPRQQSGDRSGAPSTFNCGAATGLGWPAVEAMIFEIARAAGACSWPSGSKRSVRRPVLVPVAPLARIATGREHHVDVGVLPMVLVRARADDEEHRIGRSAVLETVAVANPSLEPGGVPRSHRLLTLVGDEHDFSLDDVDELILVRMPVALARPDARRETNKIDAKLREPRRVAKTEPRP